MHSSVSLTTGPIIAAGEVVMDMVTVVMLLICPWLQGTKVEEPKCDNVASRREEISAAQFKSNFFLQLEVLKFGNA